jgi:hypothetical protein
MSAYHLLAVALVFFARPAAAQTKFGASLGPNFILDLGRPHVMNAGFPLTGGSTEGVNVAGFAERGAVRLEVMYNRLKSIPSSWHFITPDSIARHAMLDEAIALNGVGILPLARSRRISFYLAGGAGVVYSRLGTNPQPGDPQITQRETGIGLGLNAGIGLRVHFSAMELMLESRLFRSLNEVRGRSFVPIQLGVVVP